MSYKNITEIEEIIMKDISNNGGKLSEEKKDLIYKEYKDCTKRIIESMNILDTVAEEFNTNGNTKVDDYLEIASKCERDSAFKRFLGNWIDKSLYIDLVEYETGFIDVERKTVKLLNGITILIEIEGGQARAIGFRDGKQLDKIYEHNIILTETEKRRLVKKSIEEFKDL